MRHSVLVLILMLLGGCAVAGPVLQYEDNGVKISCQIKKIKIKSYSEREQKLFDIKSPQRTLVYADMVIQNESDEIHKINLENYLLSLRGINSSVISIDSIASVIISDEKLQSKEVHRESVYWVFDGALQESDTAEMTLLRK